MAAADIFVLPSRFEGLPMSVIEAMLTGLPVLATDVRGPAEQVVPEVTGLLVPPGDASALAAALQRLVADQALAGAHGRGGPRARGGVLRRSNGGRAYAGPVGIVGSIPRRMTDIVPIRRALISVSDKAGLVPFAQALAAQAAWRSCPPAARPKRCARLVCR